MTNTTQPMTSREAFEKAMTKGYNRALKKSAVKIDEHGEYECDYMSAAWDGYQASEANQQAVISEKDKQIAELVDALEIAREMIGHKDNIALIDAAIAKVKGK